VIIAKRQFSQSVSDIDKMAIFSIMDSTIQTKFVYSKGMVGGRRLLESSLRSTEEEVNISSVRKEGTYEQSGRCSESDA
jgi:hypothetical protein